MTLPRMLFRVEYEEGFGFPECTRRERTKRTYDNAADARQMVEEIRRIPTHHRLIAVYQTPCDWVEVPEELILCPAR